MADAPDNLTQNEERKLGPMTTPNGGAGAANPQTITASKQTIGPLADGAYSIEGDVDFYALQGAQSVVSTLTAGQVIQFGVRIPARTEVGFNVDAGEDWIAWVRVAAPDGADLRCNDRSNGKLV